MPVSAASSARVIRRCRMRSAAHARQSASAAAPAKAWPGPLPPILVRSLVWKVRHRNVLLSKETSLEGVLSVPVLRPSPDQPRCPRCRTGSRRQRICPAPSGRSKRRCGPASPPPAAPSRKSFAVVEQQIKASRRRSPRRGSAVRRSGRSSTTPTSRPGTVPPRRGRCCAGVAAWSCAGTSTATRRWAGTTTSWITSTATASSSTTAAPVDDFFASVSSQPEIYPIYWSPAQMQARQSDRMARVQAFLNSLWKHESGGVQWFDPDRDSLYPDRIRRRPPGTDSGGLGSHLDPGTLDLWLTRGLPAGIPPPVRRHRRAIRPLGRRLPYHRAAVSRHHDVLRLPHLPGLDRLVRHGSRPGCCTLSPSPAPWLT